jgi:hypothetical protein
MEQVMKFLGVTLLASLAAVSTLIATSARADDFKLKDGTTISGTIVGFEDNSFKVKTSYGFALVQKDQVVSINVSGPPKSTASAQPSAAPAAAPAAEKPKSDPVVASATPAPPPVPAPVASKPAPRTSAVITTPSAPVVGSTSSKTAPPALPTASTAANLAPPKPPTPEPIHEQVTGNTYTNETYRFHMYKPPDWDVIASAPAVLPGAITAMGTPDDTTYLLIGQEPAGKSLTSDMDATEHRLRDVMENFRPLGEDHITVAGTSAMEHHFRGSVDQHDWSGVVVLVSRGGKVYTIFGMTRADNDLVQLQENVISRAIASLQFTE